MAEPNNSPQSDPAAVQQQAEPTVQVPQSLIKTLLGLALERPLLLQRLAQMFVQHSQQQAAAQATQPSPAAPPPVTAEQPAKTLSA